MNFQEFQATRRKVEDLEEETGVEFYGAHGEFITQAGYVYDGDSYIEICDDGEVMLTLCNEDWKLPADRLHELEARLYDFCCSEIADDATALRS